MSLWNGNRAATVRGDRPRDDVDKLPFGENSASPERGSAYEVFNPAEAEAPSVPEGAVPWSLSCSRGYPRVGVPVVLKTWQMTKVTARVMFAAREEGWKLTRKDRCPDCDRPMFKNTRHDVPMRCESEIWERYLKPEMWEKYR